jgi:asparagine synthase (glutamine-hydrolysing)
VESLERTIDYDALLRSLVFLWSPGEHTLLNGVKKLKPGHFLVIKDQRLSRDQCFWSWPEYKPDQQVSETAAERVREAIRQSVEDQLVADVPVGAFLSGGLDSSMLVGLANRKSMQAIQCFTIDIGESNGEFIEDLPYAEQVARHLSVPLNVLKITPDIVSLLPKMVYHLDELQADASAINVMLICEYARQKGIKVLLSGAGGDDIFTGYRRHYALSMERYWSWLPGSLRVGLKWVADKLPQGSTFGRRAAKAFKYADLDGSERLLSYFYWIDPTVVRDLFVDDIQAKISPSPMSFLLAELDSQSTKDPLERMLYLERRYFLVDHNFNYTDKMSMATGVEVRVPFLDKRVANVASSISVKLKQKGAVGKWILKKSAEAILPSDIIYRPKSGFGAPIRSWIKNDLAAYVDQQLSFEKVRDRGIFKPDKVRRLIDDDRRGIEDYSYPIFALLCFELWCQTFLDQQINN